MKRGEIWWAELPVPECSKPGYRRPVLIVQSDAFNRSRVSDAVLGQVEDGLKLILGLGD
ncbi:MAG: type II toxin-antitoxin system PemK/MazF family toxin [Proteobacteria bacterium]|nr:type II toxin-antitoxin system PemK/MazF family toxin [Pseudomonadota bacterium]